MIAIITALREELAGLLRRARIDRVVTIGRRRCHVGMLNGTPVVLLAGGEGVERAARAACELLERFDISLLIGAGIAGAIDPSLRFGEVIVATEVRTAAGDSTRCAALPDHAHRGTILSVDRIVGSKRALSDSAARGGHRIRRLGSRRAEVRCPLRRRAHDLRHLRREHSRVHRR